MKVTRGDILQADGLICIPVNCVGVAGAGLAKQWKEQQPEYHALYPPVCASGEILTKTTLINWYWLLPTKGHWRGKSDWAKIEPRLKKDLTNIGEDDTFDTINIPKIGCGLGGLSWNVVYPLLTDILLDFEERYDKEATIWI